MAIEMGNTFNGKILIIGLGEIGYSIAEFLKENDIEADGFDISEAAKTRALDAGIISGIAKDFSDYDYYIIAISTHNPQNQFEPYMTSFYQLIETIAKEGKPNALISVESTIPYGTTRKISEIVDHRMHVAHIPHRYYNKEKSDHGVRQLRVLGTPSECCRQVAHNFYGGKLGIPIHPVKSPEVAELTKIVENTYRYLQISFAEELKIVCDSKNVDFEELRKACNTKWNINILENQKGIGGHCLPKDTKMFLSFANGGVSKSLLETAMVVDMQYRAHIMEKPLEQKIEM
jgi:nucleotide sugar dehydrogenase